MSELRKEIQLEFKIENRGGARQGAGRKAIRGNTKVMRIPEKYLPAINALMDHLDKQSELTHYHSEVKCKDLKDHDVSLIFDSKLL